MPWAYGFDRSLLVVVVFGANLDGNLTPILSASTLVAVSIIHENDLATSFGRFVKLAIPFTALQIALATVSVLLVLRQAEAIPAGGLTVASRKRPHPSADTAPFRGLRSMRHPTHGILDQAAPNDAYWDHSPDGATAPA